MTRALLASAALVLLCAATVQASRYIVEDANTGRDLLQAAKQPNCTLIDKNCDTCRNQRIPGTRRSETVCSTCKTGYRLRRDAISKTCDCAPGLAMDVNKVCQTCTLGKYCLGGDAKINPNNTESDCPGGLQTIFAGAKSQAQCFTKAGYGRTATKQANGQVALSAVQCPVGTYNVGGNTAGCQKCSAGLTTAASSSNSASLCLAPAGSYMDKGIGKLCQKGTYSTDLNSNATCIPCQAGVTTASEGSTSPEQCTLALMGYYLSDTTNPAAVVASPCPVNTYSDQEAAVMACTPCPHDWRTKDTGATGLALCLAPPGYELKDGADNITACDIGSYKQDWNRNPCISCGTGLITNNTGSVSKDACLVPAGWGLTQLTPAMVAAPCEQNTYGDSVDRVAVANARCTACPTDMFTMDVLTNTAHNASELYTSEEACKVKPGWGITSTLPQQCPVGSYNAGYNRQPCTTCGTGWTTVAEGKTSADACVIQPGWKMAADGVPAPCDKGTYSTGGIEGAPNATCTPCNTGYSTQEDESTSSDMCEICAPGYGGSGCQPCGYNTFASGGAKDGDACVPCATGSVAGRRASQSQQCYSNLIDARNDVFNLGDESAWVGDGATSASACGSACTGNSSCVMYRFALATTTCQVFMKTVGGAKTLGLKVGNADDYAVYQIDAAQTVGQSIATPSVADEAACLAACSDNSECELYTFDGTKCVLLKSELDADYVSMFQVSGSHLYSDVHLQ